MDKPPTMSRQEAANRFGLSEFAATRINEENTPKSTRVTLLSTEYPDYVGEALLGVAVDDSTK